jgi:hypothetical protein
VLSMLQSDCCGESGSSDRRSDRRIAIATNRTNRPDHSDEGGEGDDCLSPTSAALNEGRAGQPLRS